MEAAVPEGRCPEHQDPVRPLSAKVTESTILFRGKGDALRSYGVASGMYIRGSTNTTTWTYSGSFQDTEVETGCKNRTGEKSVKCLLQLARTILTTTTTTTTTSLAKTSSTQVLSQTAKYSRPLDRNGYYITNTPLPPHLASDIIPALYQPFAQTLWARIVAWRAQSVCAGGRLFTRRLPHTG